MDLPILRTARRLQAAPFPPRPSFRGARGGAAVMSLTPLAESSPHPRSGEPIMLLRVSRPNSALAGPRIKPWSLFYLIYFNYFAKTDENIANEVRQYYSFQECQLNKTMISPPQEQTIKQTHTGGGVDG